MARHSFFQIALSLSFRQLLTATLPLEKPDDAGRTVTAIQLWVSAMQAFIAEKTGMFLAILRRRAFGVTGADIHLIDVDDNWQENDAILHTKLPPLPIPASPSCPVCRLLPP
jgi:hypothetical protein